MKDIIHARSRRLIHTFSIIPAMALAWGLLCSLPAKGQIMQSKSNGGLQPLIGRLIAVSADKVRYNPGGTIQVTYNCSRCSCPCGNPYTDEV